MLMILPSPYEVIQVARILSYTDLLWSQKTCISRPYCIEFPCVSLQLPVNICSVLPRVLQLYFLWCSCISDVDAQKQTLMICSRKKVCPPMWYHNGWILKYLFKNRFEICILFFQLHFFPLHNVGIFKCFLITIIKIFRGIQLLVWREINNFLTFE